MKAPKAAEEARARWQLPAEASSGDFAALLAHIAERIPAFPCRVMPSSFDPADPDLRGIPWTLEPKWPSLEGAIRDFRCEGLVVRLPLFWQIEAPLHAACRGAGAYLFINEPENMPLGAAAAKLAETDLIVTTPADAAAFAAHLAERAVPVPRAWFLVHPIHDLQNLPAALLTSAIVVAQEVHLFPGIPLLIQCEAQRRGKELAFHGSEEFALACEDGRLFASSVSPEHPLPFERHPVPGEFEERACACGQPAYAPKRHA